MGRYLAFLVLGLLSGIAAGDPAGDEAARRLEAALSGLEGLRAEFRQVVTDAGGRVIERAEGTVALARPGRFRWSYREPEQQIVSDGNAVWYYDVGLEQVTIRPAAETLQGTPAMILTGEGRVGDEFAIEAGGRADGRDWVVLKPRDEQADFREMRIGLDGDRVSRMVLHDRLGQTTVLEFSGVERNPRFAPGTFSFTPPPGVDVVGRVPGEGPA